jgi:predicted secreted protein
MKKSRFVLVALAFALIVPLATLVSKAQQPGTPEEKVVTEADNGSSVTLDAGEVLVVRLKENPSTGYSRALVSFPNMPVRLMSYKMLDAAPATAGAAPLVGAPRVGEWRFAVAGEATYGRAIWLKLLTLRPFAKGIDGAGLWEIKVNVPKTPAQ